jgi:minor extracellular serine protease Vpr
VRVQQPEQNVNHPSFPTTRSRLLSRCLGLGLALVIAVPVRAATKLTIAATLGLFLSTQSPHIGIHAQEPPGEIAARGVDNETPELWFVELNGAPTADGGSLTAVRAEKAAFRAAAARAGVRFTERYAYDTLFNGLSIRIDPSAVSKLSRIPGVRAVYPVVAGHVEPRGSGEELELATAIAMTGADVAHVSGLTGAGVRVAVMDTGVDYDHPDLGGCFGANCRVEKGHDFVGDKFNADPASPGFNIVPVPDADPDDCNGHGTHVAGIVGANGTLTGVAPRATLYAYRVFGCEGSTLADIMIAAMERALADGANVLNMSIGAAFQWPQYPTAAASDRLVNNGVTVVASIGNSGANGLYSASAPGVASKVIGVASFDNTHVSLPFFTVSPDNTAIGYNAATGAPAPPTSGQFPMARTGTSASTNDACNGVPFTQPVADRVALIRRGICSFHEKALNAQNAGALAVVIYNNVAGRVSPSVAGTPAITIPVVSISDTEGVLINNRLAAGPVTMTWTNQVGSFPNPTGNLISSFSSYGLSPDLDLKPDIGAPGGFIRSTWPLEKGGYLSAGGTSMASPHVAGAVALLLQANPNTSSNAVRDILQNSAVPRRWWGNPALGLLDNVHRQGAGMLNIADALQATTRVVPGKLALGESEAGPATRTLTIRNDSSEPTTYSLGHTPALSTGPNTFTPTFFTTAATVAFSQSGLPVTEVTVPPGGTATVDATISITAPSAPSDRRLYGGYLQFLPVGGGNPLRVPYAGYRGDYQSIQVLTPTANGFPWLARLTGASFFKVPPANASFTMVDSDVPFVLVHLDHQPRMLRLEVEDVVTGKSWHRAFQEGYLGRNSTATGFFALSWDGETVAGNRMYTVPDGLYVLKLSVLKALGDALNPAHWETWTSPEFTIDRP